MSQTPENWTVHEGRDPEAELRSLQRRFRAIRRRYDRMMATRRFLRSLRLVLMVGVPSFLVAFAGFMVSPFDPLTTIRHIAAFPSCAVAREVGLAPSHRGEPGYWARLDRDEDGIACEVWR